jgi:hypothetical protein
MLVVDWVSEELCDSIFRLNILNILHTVKVRYSFKFYTLKIASLGLHFDSRNISWDKVFAVSAKILFK